jgi:hypothetical protein
LQLEEVYSRMDAKQAFAQLISATEKLHQETVRLRRDVEALRKRFNIGEEDQAYQPPPPSRRKRANIMDVLEEFDGARHCLELAEIDLRRIDSKLHQVIENEASREEMRDYLVGPKR